jgi:hypothetical protein
MDADRRRWLERLAAACEHVLAGEEDADLTDAHLVSLHKDVAGLLARLRAELNEPEA